MDVDDVVVFVAEEDLVTTLIRRRFLQIVKAVLDLPAQRAILEHAG